ncbi:MAG: flavin reductase family protein [Thermodesulfobacteriota bacterium]
MAKPALGAKAFIYPMPVTLVGALVHGQPNYLTIAFCAPVNHSPVVLAVGLNEKHYTNMGIRENRTFSVNIPSEAMVKLVDLCGLVSGHRADKSKLFTSFYGRLNTAPMIEECPLNFECRLIHEVELPGRNVYFGEVVQAYAEERFLTEGRPDLKKMNPFVFTMPDNTYWSVGDPLGPAWRIGQELKSRLREKP